MAETWTAEQHAAITESRHLLLVANAGTGKTSTVVGKILWRLGYPIGAAEDGPVEPCGEPCALGQIAAITFTEKAAQDLRRKLRQALSAHDVGPGEIDRAFVGTIHSFCGEILRQHALRLDIDPSFQVMDSRESSLRLGELVRETILEALESAEPDVIELLKDAPLDRYGPFGPAVTDFVRRAMDDIRWHRDRFSEWFADPSSDSGLDRELDADLLLALAPDSSSGKAESREVELRHVDHMVAVYRIAYRVLGRWLTLLEKENRRDFDSLILDVRRLLSHEEFAPALDALRSRYRLLIVDEFQDTDRAQRDIALAIGGLEGHGVSSSGTAARLFLVGDPKQSIYGFRNADVRVWNEVERRFSEVGAVLRLGRNFRSDPALVQLVNAACEPAFAKAGTELAEADTAAVVDYDPLDPGVAAGPNAGVDWLAPEPYLKADERKAQGATLLAARIARLLFGDSPVRVRGDAGRERQARPSDIAVLAARAETLTQVEQALRERGIPVFNSSSRGLADRQEVMDAINALRLADNPRDDLRAFAFLRSPFVGLRDEVIARIRLDRSIPGRSLLERARAWLDGLEAGRYAQFEAPEHPEIAATERFALQRGLLALSEARQLVGRAEPADVLDSLLGQTDYRLHLQFRTGHREANANLDRLRRVLGQFRALSLADFLHAWDRAANDRHSDLDTAPPAAGSDGAVFLTTIHGAKGLEWPIVAIAGAEDGGSGKTPGRWDAWLDPEFGPILLPPAGSRGERSRLAVQKRVLADMSESMRLMYVALTRARERIMVVARLEEPEGHAEWVHRALFSGGGNQDSLVDLSASRAAECETQTAPAPRIPEADDPGTGTGRQLDAFGFHEPPSDESGQLNLLSTENHAPESRDTSGVESARGGVPLCVWRHLDPIQGEFADSGPELSWLAMLEHAEPPAGVVPVSGPTSGRLRSATELVLQQQDPEAWQLRYLHGVLPASAFMGDSRQWADPDPVGTSGRRAGVMPGRLRGTIVHEVLERAGEELDGLLDEVIAGLEDEESWTFSPLSRGRARNELKREIERVIAGQAWREWVSGEHFRELPFVHLASPSDWRQGRIDLLVPPRRSADGAWSGALVVDFKTGRSGAPGTDAAVEAFGTQARVYREAVEAILGGARSGADMRDSRTRVLLHFTATGEQVYV